MNSCRSLSAWAAVLLAAAAFAAPARAATVLNLIGDLPAYLFLPDPAPVPSQRYPDFPTHDSVVIEDFAVTAAMLRLSAVSVFFFAQQGFDSFARVEGYEVNIYSTPEVAAQNLQGDVVHRFLPPSAASVTRVVDPQTGDEYGVVSFAVDAPLPAAGVYWVGVTPRASFSAGGDFRVAAANTTGTTNTAGENNARWNNPGQGFGGPAGSPLDASYAYAVTVVPEPSAALLALAGLAACAARRRRPGRDRLSERSGWGRADFTYSFSNRLASPPSPISGLDRRDGSPLARTPFPAPAGPFGTPWPRQAASENPREAHPAWTAVTRSKRSLPSFSRPHDPMTP